MPRYADYHRTVIGYHGTRKSIADQIIRNERAFEPSKNPDDWLGHGVYFWEYAPQQAFLWANQRKRSKKWGEEVAVLASMIRLGFCFDLLDPENVKALGQYHQAYTRAVDLAGPAKANVMAKKRLNCEVFNFAAQWLLEVGEPVDTFRAVFVPTTKVDRIWPGSGINAHAHLQLCVRNPDCILGTWLVKPIEEIDDAEADTAPEEAVDLQRGDPPVRTADPAGEPGATP